MKAVSTEVGSRTPERVAHDILSPLSVMQMSVDFVARRVRGDEAADAALQRGARSLGRVKTLVDGLLGYARAAAQPYAAATTDVASVVDDVLDGLQIEAQERGIQLIAEKVDTPVTVAATPGVLTSGLSNLVRNAIKYMGDRPRRIVTVRTRTHDARVRVEVEDTGPGVPAALAESIFEPFVRGESGEEGIGLGLATVRQITRAHGGTCGVRSRLDEGSVFWFELPRATMSAVAGGLRRAPQA